MRAMDVLYAFPAILLAIAILAALGRGITNAMIAIGIVYIPIFARIARGAVLGIRNEEFILAARAQGASRGSDPILSRAMTPRAMSSPGCCAPRCRPGESSSGSHSIMAIRALHGRSGFTSNWIA
jgi:ABC-type microcin C transport system permease subunit YejE